MDLDGRNRGIVRRSPESQREHECKWKCAKKKIIIESKLLCKITINKIKIFEKKKFLREWEPEWKEQNLNDGCANDSLIEKLKKNENP